MIRWLLSKLRKSEPVVVEKPGSWVYIDGVVGGTVDFGGVDCVVMINSHVDSVPNFESSKRFYMVNNSFGHIAKTDEYGIDWVS